MNMLISGVSEKEGKKIAYVRFEEESRFAEAVIPDCRIMSSEGFTDSELSQLEQYLTENLSTLKREAASVNPIRSLMREN